MKKFFRQLLLNWARKIIMSEGLICADVRKIGTSYYLVNNDNQFFKVGAAPDPAYSAKNQIVHNLNIIK